jgi:hypothetical protein
MKILLLSLMLLTGEWQGVSPPSHCASQIALGGLTPNRSPFASFASPKIFTSMPSIQDEGGLSDDAIDRAGEQVMNGHDFRSVRRRVLEKVEVEDLDKGFLKEALSTVGSGIRSFFEAIGDFFRWLFSGSGNRRVAPPPPPAAPPTMPYTGGGFTFPDLSGLGTVLIFVCVAAVIFVLIALIVKSIEARKKKASDGLDELGDALADITAPPGELAASTYEGRAIQMARDGNYRAAIRELLLGSMSWIERAGLIRYRKGLTNRDYVRSVWRRMDKREAYLMTATQFEYVFFGRRIPTAEMFEQCLTSFRGAFREEETPTAAV